MTSSPALIPTAMAASVKLMVPLLTTMQCLALVYSAITCSKCAVRLNSVTNPPSSMYSHTARFSSSPNHGFICGMKLSVMIAPVQVLHLQGQNLVSIPLPQRFRRNACVERPGPKVTLHERKSPDRSTFMHGDVRKNYRAGANYAVLTDRNCPDNGVAFVFPWNHRSGNTGDVIIASG